MKREIVSGCYLYRIYRLQDFRVRYVHTSSPVLFISAISAICRRSFVLHWKKNNKHSNKKRKKMRGLS